MGQCNCEKENIILKKNKNSTKYVLLALIIIGLVLIYSQCSPIED